jgi:hypothetical protein
MGPFSTPSLNPTRLYTALDYLNLNGDLHWLVPLDEHTAKQMSIYHSEDSAATRKQMADLQNAADQIGLKLPAGFVRFMTDRDLQIRIPSATACYFTFEPLIKLKSSHPHFIRAEGSPDVQVMIDGYAMKFFSDQQGW